MSQFDGMLLCVKDDPELQVEPELTDYFALSQNTHITTMFLEPLDQFIRNELSPVKVNLTFWLRYRRSHSYTSFTK
jgi:hypothetical protein